MRNALFLVGILVAIGCQEDDALVDNCPSDLVCTLEFRTIGVDVYSNGAPLVFDEYIVTDLETGERIEFEEDWSSIPGTYVIATDALVDKVKQSGSRFLLEGFTDGVKIFEKVYLVGHDCCHIILIEQCDEDLLCTEEYRSIIVDITNADGSPRVFDSYTVTNVRTGQELQLSRSDILNEGSYIIAEDNMIDEVAMSGTPFSIPGVHGREQIPWKPPTS